MRQRLRNVEATARLHARGDGVLCARAASGEEDTEPRERQERQDRGIDVGRLGRVRELPLGINPGEVTWLNGSGNGPLTAGYVASLHEPPFQL